MSKYQDKLDNFFNHAESVQAEEGRWYYSESSVEQELIRLHKIINIYKDNIEHLEQ
jgi:hypothetical protein